MTQVQIKRLHSLTGHRDAIYTLHPGDRPSTFFSGAGDGMVARWDLEQPDHGELIAKLPNSVYSLHYLASRDVLIAGHNYEGIHLLDWENKKELASLKLSTAAIFDMQSVDDRLFVGSGDGSVTLIDLKTLSVVRRVKASEKSARTIAVNRDRGEIAVGFSDHHIRIYDFD